MDCRRLLEEMNLYIDGSLEKELCEQLEAHLKGCERCRIVLDTTRKTITLFCDQDPVEIPSEVRDRLHRLIRSNWNKSK
jgi:predicted anti-sigma-YlaC factor YlaD